MWAQNTDEVFLMLLQIENHDDATEPIRLVLNNEDIDSTCGDFFPEAKTFAGGIFQIELPEESGDNLNTVRIAIDNVDQQIVLAARNVVEPPRVFLWVVTATAVNTVEAGPFRFILESISYDQFFVRGELRYEEIQSRRWPQHDFTPHNTPGMF